MLTPEQAEKAARVFISACRREWVKKYAAVQSARPCPIQNLEDYPPADRFALIRAIKTAVESAVPA